MLYDEIPEFSKEFKKLKKRFPTLEKDLETAKRNAIEIFHVKRIDTRAIFEIPSFCNESLRICKLRKFACKSLKGRGVMSGIRIIYGFYPDSFKVIFLEIYFKGDRENENKQRIENFLNQK